MRGEARGVNSWGAKVRTLDVTERESVSENYIQGGIRKMRIICKHEKYYFNVKE